MNNKYLLIFLLVFSATFAQLQAQSIGEEAVSFRSQKGKWGLGVEGGFGASTLFRSRSVLTGFPDAWWAITLHIPETSFLLSAGMTSIRGNSGLNANIDFSLGAFSPTDWFELHIFLGFGASIYGYSNGLGLSAGLRLPLGMSFWLWDWFQIYLNLTPIVGVGVGVGDPVRLWLHLDAPFDLGVRFWF